MKTKKRKQKNKDKEFRLECLKIANSVPERSPKTLIAVAKVLENYLDGKRS
ncbi:MAG TPA: hypothetical protein VKG26_10160 [Bacteroidia bacterium]|nr:hypothetical protein [Bacteroidia bacterium]